VEPCQVFFIFFSKWGNWLLGGTVGKILKYKKKLPTDNFISEIGLAGSAFFWDF